MVADSKKIDKFLIRYAPIASTITGDFTELFAGVESQAKDHRLKCAIVGEEVEAGALADADGAPVEVNTPHDAGIDATTPPSQDSGSGLEKLAFERSTSSLGNAGQAILSPPQEPSVASTESEEQLQKELNKARQQLKDLATRNQELSQRLSAVEQSVIPFIYSS